MPRRGSINGVECGSLSGTTSDIQRLCARFATARLGGGPSDRRPRTRFPQGRLGKPRRPSSFQGKAANFPRPPLKPRGPSMTRLNYETKGGIRIEREIVGQTYTPADTALADALDERRGVLFSSSFEFPGRYTRWDMGFVDPPLAFTARGRRFSIDALNERGRILLDPIAESLTGLAPTCVERAECGRITGQIERSEERFPEESRSRQPSIFSVSRALIDQFRSTEDQHLGLYGAFGYD